MNAYQTNQAGLLTGATSADESPLEAGVYLMPAGAVGVAPPIDWPQDKWPRWDGAQWLLVNKPNTPAEPTPEQKLAQFLQANPDVAALVEPAEPV